MTNIPKDNYHFLRNRLEKVDSGNSPVHISGEEDRACVPGFEVF
jgi:hypothetical protein